MNQTLNRAWKILSWNVRGINSNLKWDSIRNKATECGCDIICLQETKKTSFDLLFLKNICPSSFDNFAFVPSDGASGGMLVAWKGSFFEGTLVFHNEYAMSMEFKSLHNGNFWLLTNIHAPCTPEGKRESVSGSKT
jgi:exonuclease III